jgi:ferredoxin
MPGDTVLLYAADLQLLFDALHRHGYHTIGPTVQGEMVIYTEIQRVSELPAGWSDEQKAGAYRLRQGDGEAYFGFTPAAHTWKNWLRPASERLWSAEQTAEGYTLAVAENEPPNYAFIGVRACELRAIQIQDRVLLHGAYVDAEYQARRERTFVVAVNCTRAGGACFCVSMDAGPQVANGYDLALTELEEKGDHFFVVEVGTLAGAGVMADVPHRPATEDEREQADCAVAAVAAQMGRTLETDGLQELLYRSLEHPIWTEIGERCLTCGNCTMVCPTCFCATVEDVTDLSGQTAERWRRSDSCFTSNFSYIYGGSVRASARSRYRQWLTHKLATWYDQFGTSGCVGCGRCITWCPVGIDLTQEVARLQRLTRDETSATEQERSTA